MPRKTEDIEKVHPDFRLNEYLTIQKKSWKFQKAGWVVLFIFLAISAAGLFGDGILSKSSAVLAGATINYQKYYRREAPMNLEFKLQHATGAVISFSENYIKKIKVQSILPEPHHNEIKDGRVHYYFNGNGKMDITFHITPQKTGSLEGSIGVNGQAFNLSQFIYP